MSVRNFERVFTREVRSAPSRYVAQLRVEAARRQFAQTEKSIDLAPKARVNPFQNAKITEFESMYYRQLDESAVAA